MPEQDLQTNFDKAIQLIYDLKSHYLNQLLIDADEVKKDFFRDKLSELDEKKCNLYRIKAEEIEPFMQVLELQYSQIGNP